MRALDPTDFAKQLAYAREPQPPRVGDNWDRERRVAWLDFLESEAKRRIRFAKESLETIGRRR